jgi:triacylglycerol lipase
MYQIYQKGDTAIINIRGSTAKKISWLENIYSMMIPSKGKIKISGKNFRYCFARDPRASVHAGYALAIAFLSDDVLTQIKTLNRQGIYYFIITGHSQGGALANLLRAYLENLPLTSVSKKNRFKTYAFAAPMTGDKEFAKEYNSRYCIANTSFNIVNPDDPIPKFPLSYNETNAASQNLNAFLFEGEFRFKKVISESLIHLLEGSIKKSVAMFSASVSDQIAKELGPFTLPPCVPDINYSKLNNRIEINPVVYPKILRDSSAIEFNNAFFKKGEDGNFLNKKLYEKQPWSYQHKPYNYYVSILNLYFPEQYRMLETKYLSENLR